MSEEKTLSVIGDLAESYGMSKEQFEAALKATVVPANISNAQFAAFCLVAKEYGLNPITKEIYAFPAKGGGIVPVVGVDGWCNIINSNPAFNGMEFNDIIIDGKLTAITCKMFRKDRDHSIECTEYMEECKRDVDTWKKWPARMLRHKALIQCARYAFGLAGIYDQDEAERLDLVDVTPTVIDSETGEQVACGASPFNNASSRNTFTRNVQKSYAEAISHDALETIRTLNKPKLDAMRISKSEHDRLAHDQLVIDYEMAVARLDLLKKENEIAERLNRQLDRQAFGELGDGDESEPE